jgi:pyruvate dehydrogenase E1 component
MVVMNAYPVAPAEPVESDQGEVAEWLEAFDQIVEEEGPIQANELLQALVRRAQEAGVEPPTKLHTPYKNASPSSRS